MESIRATDSITSTIGEYIKLSIAEALLNELEKGGVSEWAGYNDAVIRAMALNDHNSAEIDWTDWKNGDELDV